MFALVAAGVFLVTFNAVRPVFNATASDLAFLLAALAIAIALVDPQWKFGRVAPGWLLASGGLLLTAALLVGIFPAQPSQAALLFPSGVLGGGGPGPTIGSNTGVAVRFVAALVAIPVLIAISASSPRRIMIIGEMWIAGATMGALVGLFDYLGVVNLNSTYRGSGVVYVDRAIGLTNHPNALGLVSAMALPFAASQLGGSRGRSRIYYSVAIALLISGIGVSGSRSALVAGVLGLVFVGALHRLGRRALIRTAGVAALLIAVVALAISPPPAVERLLNRSDPHGYEALSTQQRAEIYPAVWHEVLQRPVVGHGFEYVRGAHNVYLQLLHAGGITALIGFLTFAGGVTVTGFRLGRDHGLPHQLQNLASASVASGGAWFAGGGLFGTAIFDRYLYVPAGLITAIWALRKRSPG
jgi:O-antigen ligase